MANSERNLDRLYVASPCSADWEAMPGNDQVRFCNQCQLNVYNISAMTRKQAETLITNTEGRLCTKLYRRADGTIITQDCPKGLQAVKRRVSRVTSATLSAVIGLFTSQTIGWAEHNHKHCTQSTAKITRVQSNESAALLWGTIYNPEKTVIPKAFIRLVHEKNKTEITIQSDEEGRFRFSSLTPGNYNVRVQAIGLASYEKKKLKVSAGESLQLSVILQFGTVGGAAFLPTLIEKEKGQETIV